MSLEHKFIRTSRNVINICCWR